MPTNERSKPAYTFAPSSVSTITAVLKVSRRAAQNRFVTAIRAIGRFTIGALNQQGWRIFGTLAMLDLSMSDLTIALNWITSSSRQWLVFVANRVGEIQRLTEVECWRYIATPDNPADTLSRGINPYDLIDAER